MLAVKKEKNGRRRRWPAAGKERGRVEEDQADLFLHLCPTSEARVALTAEYGFITQDHATSIQMKLAWRACLERNISRSPDFICLDMSSAHRKTRLAWLAGKSAAAPRRASPRGDTQDTQHKCTIKIKLRSQSRWSHTQCGAGPRPSRLEPATACI